MTDPGYPTPDPNTTPAAGVPPQAPPPSYGIPQPMPPGAPQQPYPQAPYAPVGPPPGYASSEDKTWALVATFGAAAGNLFCGVAGFVPPLIAFLARGSASPTVRQHAVASLNFQLPISAITIVLLIIREVSAPDIFTGSGSAGIYWLALLAGWVVAVVGIIFGIIGGIKANEGTVYKYPFSLNIIK